MEKDARPTNVAASWSSVDLEDPILNRHSSSISPTRVDAVPSASSAADSTGSQTFEFVLVTDAESRRQVRRHAMRQYMRQRRLDGIARLGSSRVPLPRWSPRTEATLSPSDSSSKVEELDDSQKPESEVTRECNQVINGSSRTTTQSTTRLGIQRNEVAPVKKVSPDPIVSPGRGGLHDPFSSYPVKVSQEDQKLISHCKCICLQRLSVNISLFFISPSHSLSL
jgi:hypothetical protein